MPAPVGNNPCVLLFGDNIFYGSGFSHTLKAVTAYPLHVYGFVQAFESSTLNPDYFSVFSSSSAHPSAQDYYDRTIEYWTDERWTAAVNRAGLNM